MIKDEPPDQTIAIQQFGESETLLGTRNGTNDMLSLISKFLESAGNVLLVQGPPGAGKTTLALELLRRVQATRMGSTVVPPARFYVPSRVSPNKLRKHCPWIHDMHDPLSKNTSRENSIEGSAEIRVSDADDIFNKVLTLKRSRLRGLMVIASWDGALRNTSEDGRRMIESAILSDPDDNRVGVVLVSEGGRVGDLPNLVDGIVTLSSSELDGRRLRTIVVNKLRGQRVKSDRALFSLDKGKFKLLTNTQFESDSSKRPHILSPVPHTESFFSTGSQDLDLMLKGGIRKGSSILIDVNNTVPTMGVRLLLRIINANFVNQGGFSCIVPFSTVSSKNVAESLRPLVGEAALNERIRIMEYNQELPPEEWRVQLKGNPLDDFTLFGKIWKKVETYSSSIILTIDLDKLVQVYGDSLMLPSLTKFGASISAAGAVPLPVTQEPNKIREAFLRTADYYLKIESINDTMAIYGVKPFTNVYGAEFAFDSGYPSLKLIEIV